MEAQLWTVLILVTVVSLSLVTNHPTQRDRDGLSGYRAEAADDAGDLHVLAGSGRRPRGPTGHARNECVHNLRTVDARAAALHAVVVH